MSQIDRMIKYSIVLFNMTRHNIFLFILNRIRYYNDIIKDVLAEVERRYSLLIGLF